MLSGKLKKLSSATGSAITKRGQSLLKSKENSDKGDVKEQAEEIRDSADTIDGFDTVSLNNSKFVQKVTGRMQSVGSAVLKHGSEKVQSVRKKANNFRETTNDNSPSNQGMQNDTTSQAASSESTSQIGDASRRKKSFASKVAAKFGEVTQGIVADSLLGEFNNEIGADELNNDVDEFNIVENHQGETADVSMCRNAQSKDCEKKDDARPRTTNSIDYIDNSELGCPIESHPEISDSEGECGTTKDSEADVNEGDAAAEEEAEESVSTCCPACGKETRRKRTQLRKKAHLNCNVCNVTVCDRNACVDKAFGEFPRPEGSRCISCRGKPVSIVTRRRALPVVPRTLKASDIFVNGVPLTMAQVDIIRAEGTMFQIHGTVSPEDAYSNSKDDNVQKSVHIWYDRLTGIIGEMGQDPCTSISAGLHLGGGELHRLCSRGASTTLLNGRELSHAELREWKQVDNISFEFGVEYWMNHQGEFGVVGQDSVKSSIWRQRIAKGKKFTAEATKVGVAGLLTGGVGAVLATPGLFVALDENSSKDRRRKPIYLDRDGKPTQSTTVQSRLKSLSRKKSSAIKNKLRRKNKKKEKDNDDERDEDE